MSRPLHIDTRVSDVLTRFRQVTFRLEDMAEGNDYQRDISARYAKELLWELLPVASNLVDLLGEYEDEKYSLESMIETEARGLGKKLRDRRLIAKLEQVDGRTPEEAVSFQKKARQLRRGAA